VSIKGSNIGWEPVEAVEGDLLYHQVGPNAERHFFRRAIDYGSPVTYTEFIGKP